MATQKKLGRKRIKVRLAYYQMKEGGKVVNWIYYLGGKAIVAEVRRAPYEEGVLTFFKNTNAELLSSGLDIHEFADHLNISYKPKK